MFASTKESTKSRPSSDKPKLKFNEQKELKSLPAKIKSLETQIAEMHELMASSDFYQKPGTEIAAAQAKLQSLEAELNTTFTRWEDLESRV